MMELDFEKTMTAASITNKYFAEIDSFRANATTDDVITEWLSLPPISTVTDPIAWWITMGDAGHPLAQMALDFLSSPGLCCYFLDKCNIDG
jgi:hypothetical protein